MKELKKGSKGEEVIIWQSFLFGKGYSYVEIDGDFGAKTEQATKEFQKRNNLRADGIAGSQTFAVAIGQGLPVITRETYPPKPAFSSPSSAARARMFGTFGYEILAGGQIKILGDWGNKNIVKVHIPQLKGIEGAPVSGIVYFHRAGAAQLQSLFAAWETRGLLKYVKTWAGSFVPRMVRGSRTQLSNHAFGSAFDINAAWNGLGREPSRGEGTVLPLVKLANQHGFFWGGHYNSRKDGMHFELAVLDKFPSPEFPGLKKEEINSAVEKVSAAPADIPPQENPSAYSDKTPQTDLPAILENQGGHSVNNKPEQPPDQTSGNNRKIAVEKPKPKGFFSRIWKEITALTGGAGITDVGTEKLAQVQQFGLTPDFWKRIFWLFICGSLVYLIIRFFQYRQEDKRDLQITNDLIAANTTPENKVVLVDSENIGIFKERGYQIIYR